MKYLINISFIVVLFAFSINHLLNIVDKDENAENRTLAEKPEFNIGYLDPYPSAFNNYIDDNFAGRGYLVDLYNYFNDHIFFKRTSIGKYIRGRDNFVFEMTKGLPVYLGKKSFSEEQLEKVAEEFEERQAYFNEIGAKLYIVIIPSKYQVYSDKLPLMINKGRKNIGDQFVNYLRSNTNISIINGIEVLKNHAASNNVYLKYDTHWNELGAFYVFQDLLKKIDEDFDADIKYDTSNFVFETYEKDGGNMKNAALNKEDTDFGYYVKPKNKTFKMINGYKHEMPEFPYGQYEYCRRYQSENKNGLKTVFFRDSFAGMTLGFLPEPFEETLYIWDNWMYLFNKDIVDIEKPDIVVYAIYETFVDRVLLEPSFVEADSLQIELQ